MIWPLPRPKGKPVMIRLRFSPAPDITVKELADILFNSHILADVPAHEDTWRTVDPALRRHFQVTRDG